LPGGFAFSALHRLVVFSFPHFTATQNEYKISLFRGLIEQQLMAIAQSGSS